MTKENNDKIIIHNFLIENRSKADIVEMVNFIGTSTSKILALYELTLDNIPHVSFRAAWVLGDHARQYPDMKKLYLNNVIQALSPQLDTGIKRNFCRILHESKIPSAQQGTVVTTCFDLIQSTKESIAVKSFCMSTLSNIVKHEPELKRELYLVIEDLLPQASAGIRSKARHILKELDKISTK